MATIDLKQVSELTIQLQQLITTKGEGRSELINCILQRFNHVDHLVANDKMTPAHLNAIGNFLVVCGLRFRLALKMPLVQQNIAIGQLSASLDLNESVFQQMNGISPMRSLLFNVTSLTSKVHFMMSQIDDIERDYFGSSEDLLNDADFPPLGTTQIMSHVLNRLGSN